MIESRGKARIMTDHQQGQATGLCLGKQQIQKCGLGPGIKADVGSSAMIRGGAPINARATATRCC